MATVRERYEVQWNQTVDALSELEAATKNLILKNSTLKMFHDGTQTKRVAVMRATMAKTRLDKACSVYGQAREALVEAFDDASGDLGELAKVSPQDVFDEPIMVVEDLVEALAPLYL